MKPDPYKHKITQKEIFLEKGRKLHEKAEQAWLRTQQAWISKRITK